MTRRMSLQSSNEKSLSKDLLLRIPENDFWRGDKEQEEESKDIQMTARRSLLCKREKRRLVEVQRLSIHLQEFMRVKLSLNNSKILTYGVLKTNSQRKEEFLMSILQMTMITKSYSQSRDLKLKKEKNLIWFKRCFMEELKRNKNLLKKKMEFQKKFKIF